MSSNMLITTIVLAVIAYGLRNSNSPPANYMKFRATYALVVLVVLLLFGHIST